MASSLEPTTPLRGKLHHVKYLLEDASKRLQKEMSNYEIFTTKTSAAGGGGGSSSMKPDQKETPIHLRRTISDISTLNSVLSCPIFSRIVNVTDSLNQLSDQLTLHPSIGPSDITINAEGELILAPPIEPASLNNLINSRLDEFSSNTHVISPQMVSPKSIINTNHHHHQMNHLNEQEHHTIHQQMQSTSSNNETSAPTNTFDSTTNPTATNGFSLHSSTPENNMLLRQQQHIINQQSHQQRTNFEDYSNGNMYPDEKLVSNGIGKSYVNGNRVQVNHGATNGGAPEKPIGEISYVSNGNYVHTQINSKRTSPINSSSNNGGGSFDMTESRHNNDYSNELYKTNHDEQYTSRPLGGNPQTVANYGPPQSHESSHVKTVHVASSNQKARNASVPYYQGSCSPSTSAGSTVRLADECDSSASSLNQSQAAHHRDSPYLSNTLYSNQTQANKVVDSPTSMMRSIESHQPNDEVSKLGEDENVSPDMEKIKVTLEKDSTGLGITIAGYTCEKEEISGIFIKNITPNSPAERSGKIRTLDQIYAVDGQELLGFNNNEAVKVLRHTDKTVTLELMRYLAQSKFKKLQTALAHAELDLYPKEPKSLIQTTAQQSSERVVKSSITTKRENGQSNTKPPLSAKPNFSELPKAHQEQQPKKERTYRNDHISSGIDAVDQSQPEMDPHTKLPVAVQRGSSTKIIETKQGARNTIDIRSPTYQPTSPTYANNNCFKSPSNSIEGQTRNEVTDEFGGVLRSKVPEWERDVQIVEIYRDSAQGLGFIVKDYANPKDPNQSIIMITSLTPGGIAEKIGKLACGDILLFVDDTNLEGACLNEAVTALKRTNGLVRLGVLKLKRV